MRCKRCDTELIGRQTVYCSVGCKTADYIDRRRIEFKLRAIAYKGGECQNCGYKRSVAALTFHHRDPEHKTFKPSVMYRHNWQVVTEELDKCDLLCANCHAEQHGGLTEW